MRIWECEKKNQKTIIFIFVLLSAACLFSGSGPSTSAHELILQSVWTSKVSGTNWGQGHGDSWRLTVATFQHTPRLCGASSGLLSSPRTSNHTKHRLSGEWCRLADHEKSRLHHEHDSTTLTSRATLLSQLLTNRWRPRESIANS